MRALYVLLTAIILAVGVRTTAISAAVILTPENQYDPIPVGIPDTIGGYSVLAVLTEDTVVCMKHVEKHLILQSPYLTIDDALRNFRYDRIAQELQDLNLVEHTQWGSSIVGQGVTRAQIVSQLAQWQRYYIEHGCITLGRPTQTNSPAPVAEPSAKCPSPPDTPTCSSVGGGEWKCPPGTSPGFAIAQNLDADNYTDDNAQSLYLIAPTVGNNQDRYSAFLNNVVTDKCYFLQVGFYFRRWTILEPAHGEVVWAGGKTDAGTWSAHAFPAPGVPYIAGHTYYTTISFTNGTWWTCAADTENATTYSCVEHPDATATGSTHLINHVGTSVFAENWNTSRTWVWGFTVQWPAFGAKIYRNGTGYPWCAESRGACASSDKMTRHACNDKTWLPEEAIVLDLVKDGSAYFNTDYLPPYCQ